MDKATVERLKGELETAINSNPLDSSSIKLEEVDLNQRPESPIKKRFSGYKGEGNKEESKSDCCAKKEGCCAKKEEKAEDCCVQKNENCEEKKDCCEKLINKESNLEIIDSIDFDYRIEMDYSYMHSCYYSYCLD